MNNSFIRDNFKGSLFNYGYSVHSFACEPKSIMQNLRIFLSSIKSSRKQKQKIKVIFLLFFFSFLRYDIRKKKLNII